MTHAATLAAEVQVRRSLVPLEERPRQRALAAALRAAAVLLGVRATDRHAVILPVTSQEVRHQPVVIVIVTGAARALLVGSRVGLAHGDSTIGCGVAVTELVVVVGGAERCGRNSGRRRDGETWLVGHLSTSMGSRLDP